jgi:hypothetical protein
MNSRIINLLMLDILLSVINLIIYDFFLFIWYTIIIMKCLFLKQPFADLLAHRVSPLFYKVDLSNKTGGSLRLMYV